MILSVLFVIVGVTGFNGSNDSDGIVVSRNRINQMFLSLLGCSARAVFVVPVYGPTRASKQTQYVSPFETRQVTCSLLVSLSLITADSGLDSLAGLMNQVSNKNQDKFWLTRSWWLSTRALHGNFLKSFIIYYYSQTLLDTGKVPL